MTEFKKNIKETFNSYGFFTDPHRILAPYFSRTKNAITKEVNNDIYKKFIESNGLLSGGKLSYNVENIGLYIEYQLYDDDKTGAAEQFNINFIEHNNEKYYVVYIDFILFDANNIPDYILDSWNY